MIVNPQLFNYRLITGSLIVGIAVLSILSFTNYRSNQTHQQFLEQEKKLVEIELSEMLKQYDDVSSKNNLLIPQLETAKKDVENALDSIRSLRAEVTLISKFRQRASVLQSKNRVLFNTIDSLNLVTATLEREKLKVYNALQNEREINSALSETNKNLNEVLKKASRLTANSFMATALNTAFGKKKITAKASKTKSIEVCFTIAENTLALKGKKDIYIQILTPDNNVFADKGAVNFGKSSLIYSTKKTVHYNSGVLDVCLDINAEEDDKPLIEGTYFINVFNNDVKLGSTQLHLK